ncbi:hypothetical protein O7626_12615 [Micromonospora sp. WMMD1102]|uniref:hypothetical protein n=1 Tax=Micromonospora sp. WMMD1102 TaxID=3016105 RepID=UPI002415077D|nr:hypothetical protein [Micromonospora sp. WMMD1102]MDG4786764.1 hypothetical protein [Micromonospora sp. WMMD1102]
MDSSLAILIGGTAVCAGAVAYLVLLRDLGLRRAVGAGAGVTIGVTASFLLMLYLATLAIPAVLAFVAVFAAAVGYPVFRRDLGPQRAALAAAGSAAVVTASFLFVVYLAVIAFIAAVGVYLLLRDRIRIAPALILTGTTLGGLLAASALVFWVSLSYM